MLFDAVTRMCVTTQQLTDSVLCIEYAIQCLLNCSCVFISFCSFLSVHRSYKNRAFVGLANGKVNVYTRARGLLMIACKKQLIDN